MVHTADREEAGCNELGRGGLKTFLTIDLATSSCGVKYDEVRLPGCFHFNLETCLNRRLEIGVLLSMFELTRPSLSLKTDFLHSRAALLASNLLVTTLLSSPSLPTGRPSWRPPWRRPAMP